MTGGEPLRAAPTIAHADFDAFFVAVERRRNPALVGRPVVVGGALDGRGVVSSASYEARAFGVRSAMPIRQARRLCPQATFLQARHGRYREASSQAAEILRRFSPAVYMASIDEAYLDFSGTERLWGTTLGAAESLRRAVQAELGLSLSIGLARNRLVAKICSRLAKPAGLFYCFPHYERALLAPLPVEWLPGVGPATARRLHRHGLRTVDDLARAEGWLERRLGVHGAALVRKARGEGAACVPADAHRKSLGHEVTLSQDTGDPARLLALLSYLTERVCHDLRRSGWKGRTITLKLRYADFTTRTHRRTLARAADGEEVVFPVVQDLFRQHFRVQGAVRLVGVTCAGLEAVPRQFSLFAPPGEEQARRLHRAVDRVKDRHGFNAVLRGRSSLTKGKPV